MYGKNIWKKNAIVVMLMALIGLPVARAQVSNVAYSDNQVRFTVISDGTVRLEYAPDGQFTDNKSFMAVVRNYAPVNYQLKQGSWIEITTPLIKLRYKKGDRRRCSREYPAGCCPPDSCRCSAPGVPMPSRWLHRAHHSGHSSIP